MQPIHELIIELSHNCDLACTMCGFGGKKVERGRFMTADVLEQVLDRVDPLPPVIRLNGRGESTIHPQFVPMLRRVRERAPDSQINLFTHLSRTRREVLDALIECDVHLFVSLDSPEPERLVTIRRRAKFESIRDNLERLRRLQPRPFLIFTLQELNLGDVVPIAKFALERDMHLIVNTLRRDEGIEVFQQMVRACAAELRSAFAEVGRLYAETGLTALLPDQVQGVQLQEQPTTHGSMAACPAIERELCVLHDGTVTPCNMFNPYEYGSILEDSVEELRAGESFRWFQSNHKSHYYCRNCACLGGTA